MQKLLLASIFLMVAACTPVHHKYVVTPDHTDDSSYRIIQEEINKNWFFQKKVIPQNRIRAEISLKRDGTIKDVRIIQSSGDESFDNSLVRAVRRSAPWPIPPSDYIKFETFELVFETGML